MSRGGRARAHNARKSWVRELVGFSVAGGLALGVDLAVFNALISQKVNLFVANGFAVIAALLANYVINHWVFLPGQLARKKFAKKSFRFGIVAWASALYLLIGFQVVVWLLPDLNTPSYTLARILLIGSGTIVRFFALKYWVFGKRMGEPSLGETENQPAAY